MGGNMTDVMELKKGLQIWHRHKARNFPEAWSSEEEVSDFLYGMVRMIKPERVVEIGTFEGDAAVAIARGLRDNNFGHLITTDIKDYGQEKVLSDEGLSEYVTFVKENPNEYLDSLPGGVDMVFIDDGHAYHEVIRDLEKAHRLIKVHGFILGHDVLMIPDVTRAYDNFTTRYKDQYHKIIVNSYDGVFMLKKVYA